MPSFLGHTFYSKFNFLCSVRQDPRDLSVRTQSILSELEHAISTRSGETGDILRKVTDLFLVNVGRYSSDQLDIYDGVFSKLVDRIEVVARAELARRFATISGAPRNTIHSLALDDDIIVAEPVLAQSSDLDDEILVRCAATKGQAHLLAIATRKTVSEKVSHQLVKNGGEQVLGTLAKNLGAKFSDKGLKLLVKKSVGVDWLAEAVGLRDDISEVHFRKLISKASKHVAQRLKAANPKHAAMIDAFLGTADNQDVKREITSGKERHAANHVSHPSSKSKEITEDVIKDLADAKEVDKVIDAIAHLSGLPVRQVEALIMDTWSGPVACLLKAVGFRLATLNAVYCMRRPNGEPPGDDLHEAKLEFLKISRYTADRVIRFYKVRQLDTRSMN
jgi:hypothetical protein